MAHRVNHPPPGTQPNVLQAAFDFPSEWYSAAPIPNQLFESPGSTRYDGNDPDADADDGSLPIGGGQSSYARLLQQRRNQHRPRTAVPGLVPTHKMALDLALITNKYCECLWQVLVSLKPLEDGDELFLNYRFNPNHPVPSWYTDPFPEESKRRWTQQPMGRSSG